MYVGDDLVREVEEKFGIPEEIAFSVATTKAELEFIRSTPKRGRAHDVTAIVWRDRSRREFAAIAKHHYAAGAFRPPSGGVDPGESIEEGLLREVREETGLRAEIERYVLRVLVDFQGAPADGSISWVTHVFELIARDSNLFPIDVHEIREAVWTTRKALLEEIRPLLSMTPSAGINYRIFLHEAPFAAIDRASSTRRGPSDSRKAD